MLKKIFKIISFYDEARWSNMSNYYPINFYKSDLTFDAKLLTHWICYITDRQMAFQRIWEVGGFVFSEMVDRVEQDRTLEILNQDNSTSFIRKEGKDGFIFKGNTSVNDNKILKERGVNSSDCATFASRYYPSDYFSILYTLDILSHYDFSLTKFIVEQFNKHNGTEDYVKRLLFSLYLLTYYEVGQPTKSELNNFKDNIQKAEKRTKKVLSILNESFEEEYGKFKKDAIFRQKRAWCSLRDYFKSPEFSQYFKNALKEEGVNEVQISQLFQLKSFQQFELPGDVWNNNSKFRECVLENTEYDRPNESFNKILRDYFEKNKEELRDCYPEQFDITFDFVPRMCDRNNCDICPIGFVKGKEKSNFKKSCINDHNLYCSVALIDCNYKVDCFENECNLIKNLMTNTV
ncbi:MAG: hypothetical protein Q8N05_22985 [Bacteroidota bacterium]|nr:hypothetical protein [Bacteroidota bacterium]